MAKPSEEQIEENKKVNRLIQGNKYKGCIWGLTHLSTKTAHLKL